MIKNSLYYASDKALFDALCQHQFTNDLIRELFFRRGIIISKFTDRDDLAKHYSRMVHDYHDHRAIASAFGSSSGKEKSTVTIIDGDISDDEIDQTLAKLKEEIEQSNEDHAEVLAKNDGRDLKIKYTYFDVRRSEFKQVVTKDAIISVERTSTGIAIRHPNNDYAETVKETFLDTISKGRPANSSDLAVFKIELTGIEDHVKISDFFLSIIHNMDDMEAVTVTEISVFNPKAKSEGKDVPVYIKKISFRGEGVSLSTEIERVRKGGFYICKISWLAKFKAYDSDKYTFEAQFGDPENKKNFSYITRGSYRYKGDNDYAATPRPIPRLDEVRFLKLLEKSARMSMELITAQ